MPTSYQTIPLAVPPKTLATPPEEPAPTSVPTMKKLVVAAMVGTALVGGYSYGSSTNPAMINNVNGFATGVSYLSIPDGESHHVPTTCTKPHATVYCAPDVVVADHKSWFLGPLKGDLATVCLEVCLTPSEVKDWQGNWPDKTKVHHASCDNHGYPAYDQWDEPVIWDDIYTQPFGCRAKDNDSGHNSDCARCANDWKFWPCCLDPPICEGAACKFSDSSNC